MVAYGNRQNAIAFARAHNSNLLRALKHLLETRLKILSTFGNFLYNDNLPIFGVIIKNAGRKVSINPPKIQKSGSYPTSCKIYKSHC